MHDDAAGDGRAPPGDDAAPQPAINLPGVVVALIALFVALHVVRGLLDAALADDVLAVLAFIPLRYQSWAAFLHGDPGGWWAALAGPFTHLFLHGGWLHLTVNSVWMAAFGGPLARRIGAVRFVALALLSAAAGAFAFALAKWGAPAVLIGASGAVSGMMGAMVRLIYAGRGDLATGIRRDFSTVRPLGVAASLRLPGPRRFILLWMALNLVLGVLNVGAGGGIGRIAWEAHIGGFVAGFLLLRL
ncbi:MAG TPA: rhomboid family intramembrane serine protease, partial [Thermopetrobacter sp.]|nr:rhomboid family intramembrane serine protease [Thermopetrobacter sp.]